VGQTEGQATASGLSAQTASQQEELFRLGQPSLKMALEDMIKDMGAPGSEPQSVKTAFEALGKSQNAAFDQSEKAAPLQAEQAYKQGGMRADPGAASSASDQIIAGLEDQRRATSRQRQVAETDASMQTRDFELSRILGLSEGAVSSAFGFSANAIRDASMDQRNPMGGALSGLATGAAIGTEVYPGVGTVVGGVIGGVGGYFAGGG
jgi:hypothetical protein